MSYLIRKANRDDIQHLQRLLDDYLRETYAGVWGGTVERLEQDISGKAFEILAAENADRKVVGFIAWIPTYDLHWCLRGGDVIDFYVVPESRGRGVGLLLTVEAAAEIQKRGGAFLKGGAVDNPIIRRAYNRIAMCLEGGESYVSGRAFRHLAGLSGKSVREIIKNLPETAWNYEP